MDPESIRDSENESAKPDIPPSRQGMRQSPLRFRFGSREVPVQDRACPAGDALELRKKRPEDPQEPTHLDFLLPAHEHIRKGFPDE